MEVCGVLSGFRNVRQWDVCFLPPAQVMRRYSFFEAPVPESVIVCAELGDGSRLHSKL